MQLVLTEDQTMLARTAGAFVTEHSPVARLRKLLGDLADEHRALDAVLARMTDAQWDLPSHAPGWLARWRWTQRFCSSTNHLLAWIRYDTPPWKIKLYGTVNPTLSRFKPSWQLGDSTEQLRADGAKALFGEGTDQAKKATDRGRQLLLEDGYGGVTNWIGELSAEMPTDADGAALGPVLNYFASHQGRLNYALRLRRGQSIGSGLVEGTIKQMINLRMKQTGARWKLEHVGPFVELRALAAGPEWNSFWMAP
jgi:hypothetical protein